MAPAPKSALDFVHQMYAPGTVRYGVLNLDTWHFSGHTVPGGPAKSLEYAANAIRKGYCGAPDRVILVKVEVAPLPPLKVEELSVDQLRDEVRRLRQKAGEEV